MNCIMGWKKQAQCGLSLSIHKIQSISLTYWVCKIQHMKCTCLHQFYMLCPKQPYIYSSLNDKHLLSHRFSGSGVHTWLSWVFCKSSIGVFARGAFSSWGLSGTQPTSKLIQVVGRIHFLVTIGFIAVSSLKPARKAKPQSNLATKVESYITMKSQK